ncbi:plasmid pRiA4b ORF-3 family protein [Bacillus sp. Marseille-P3661]|uniref:plasmid pRiA4b ORF-3 family protein n=1 Tax=Bacillus sp. Marseille-P3661 TaxID=1936234 RepID=UPI000C81A238|nr:plasmid pRiA4b ORF-3 family protein [Bacillus sp. Marseille-P3661]
MLIQCTKKLLDELGRKPEVHESAEPLFSWHANLITVNRRKTIVLMNDKSKYTIILHGLKAKDFKKLDETILNAIRETFQEELISDEIIEKYIHHSKEFTYAKTKDRSSVAKLNKACETVYFYEDRLNHEFIINSAASKEVSRFLVGDSERKNEYIYPNEELYKDLENFAGKPIFHSEAVQLKVTLLLERHHVWRRLVVPLNLTFSEFHHVLQKAFGWEDYHLHEFYIFDQDTSGHHYSINHSAYSKEGYRPIVNLVCDEEAFAYPGEVEMRLENGIKLSEYIPHYKSLKYNYDFGDDWQHAVEVEGVISDYDKNYPVCLEGVGATPPEDVGGESGYEEFLTAIADENHPEHGFMKNWGKSYEDFDIEMVNRMLKRL